MIRNAGWRSFSVASLSCAAFGLATALLLQGCEQPEPALTGPDAQPQSVEAASPAVSITGALRRAGTCSTEVRFNDYGGGISIKMSNGGGWCWTDLRLGKAMHPESDYLNNYRSYLDSTTSKPTATGPDIIRQPLNGDAQAAMLPDGRLRVAYHPTPGYVGADSFTFETEPRGANATVTVTVVAGG